MKVIMKKSQIETLLSEIFDMRDSIIVEARSAEAERASRKKAQEKKKKSAAQKAKAEKNRGNLDTTKAKKVTNKKQIDTGEFKNAESFSPTPEDAHLHTDGKCDNSSLRHNKPASAYAEVGDLKKNPCDKRYPKFGGKNEKARIAGGLRQAYARHDEKATKELENAARAIGMEPTGASWNERPQCRQYLKTKDPSKLPKGWTVKKCSPHGQGGGDEWLARHHSDSTKTASKDTYHNGHDTHKAQEKHKDLKHEPSARHGTFWGAGKVYKPGHKLAGQLVMPKNISPEERAHRLGHWGKDKDIAQGGRGGELARGARRTLSKKTQAERGAPARNEKTKVVRSGADWHKLTKDTTGKKVVPHVGAK